MSPAVFSVGSYEIVEWPRSSAEVGSARHCATHERVLVKIDDEKSSLSDEASVLRSASGGVGIPHLRYFGALKGWSVMILDMYGPCLEQVFDNSGRKFSLQTLLLLAIQLLSRLRYLHSRKIIHGNLSPRSFAIGSPNWQSNQIMMVDFNVMENKNKSSRDDLLALGDILSYLHSGAASWEEYLLRPTKTEPPFLASYLHTISTSCTIDYQVLQNIFQGYYEEFVCQMEIALGLSGSRALKQSLTPNLGNLLAYDTVDMRQHLAFALSEMRQCVFEHTSLKTDCDLWKNIDRLFDVYLAVFLRYKASDIKYATKEVWKMMHFILDRSSRPLRLSILYRFYRLFTVLLETLPSFRSDWVSCLSNIAVLLSKTYTSTGSIHLSLQAVAYWESFQHDNY